MRSVRNLSFLFVLAASVASAQSQFSAQAVAGTSTVSIAGPAFHQFKIYAVDPGNTRDCNGTTITVSSPLVFTSNGSASVTTTDVTPALTSAAPTSLTLTLPLVAGYALCLFDVSVDGPPTPVSIADGTPSSATVPASSTSALTSGDDLSGNLVITFTPLPTAAVPHPAAQTITIPLGAGQSQDQVQATLAAASTGAGLLAAQGFSASIASNNLVIKGPAGVSFTAATSTLTQSALVIGSPAQWKPATALATMVVDPNDYGRFRTYFVIGAQVTNQQSSTGSSTAGEYLELGFNSTYARAHDSSDWLCGAARNAHCTHHQFGLSSNIDVRLSPIPVAGSTSTVSSATAIVTNTSLNQLSSQNSVRLVSSVYAPWKVIGWNKAQDFFTVSPLARGGFGTLLNSSSSTTTPATAGNSSMPSTTMIASTTFAPAFDTWGFGARFAWDRFPRNSDKGPQTITQVLVTFGENSNLPSYVCKAASGTTNPYTATGSTVTTACSSGPYAPVSSSSGVFSYYNYSRTLIPRIDIEGFAKLPQYPFILGMDANLQQYTVFSKPNLDYLNKPGNDIRIYFGIVVDLNTLISKL